MFLCSASGFFRQLFDFREPVLYRRSGVGVGGNELTLVNLNSDPVILLASVYRRLERRRGRVRLAVFLGIVLLVAALVELYAVTPGKTTAFSGGQFAKNDEGKELVNKDGIRIVGKYVKNDEIWGKEIILFVENNTDKDITLYCDDLSVNGFMMTALLAKTVNAGKMSIVGISLFSDDLQKNDIKEVKDIELKFRVGDAVTYSNIFETGVISFSVS